MRRISFILESFEEVNRECFLNYALKLSFVSGWIESFINTEDSMKSSLSSIIL